MNCILDNICQQFRVGSPCDDTLCESIPIFWDLVCSESFGNCQLRTLLTRREAVLFLLGCEAYSTDETQSHYRMDANTVADTRSDSRTQAQATGSSTRFNNGKGATRYDENSKSRSDGSMKRTARSTEKEDWESFYRDDGRGYGFNISQSFNFIRNRVSRSADRGLNIIKSELGDRKDCNYEYSENTTKGRGAYIIVAGGGVTQSTSEWRKFSATDASSRDRDNESRFNTATENDTGLNTSRSTHTWGNDFKADIDWFNNSTEIRTIHDRSDTKRDASAEAQGNGDGINEEKTEGHSTAQGTSQTIGDSESNRTMSRVSNRTAFDLANSQRFRNLRLLYDQITEQIEHLKLRLRQRSLPVIDQLPCKRECLCTSHQNIRHPY